MPLTRIDQLMKEGRPFFEARIIARHEKFEAFYKEAEEQGCSWYEVQMLRRQDRLLSRLEDISDQLYRMEEKQ